MKHKIIQGNVYDDKIINQIPDKLVDMCITSPPYWGLRDYGIPKTKWGDGWIGQLGLEPTPQHFVQHLVEIFDKKIKPKLADHGTLWVNLGDTYHGGNLTMGIPDDWESLSTRNMDEKYNKDTMTEFVKARNKATKIKKKSLTLVPYRFAIAMVDNGWICRNIIIWHKPNPMPESVKDRFTNDFEPIFLFAKKSKYYFKQQFEPYASLEDLERRNEMGFYKDESTTKHSEDTKHLKTSKVGKTRSQFYVNEDGRNKRSTWTINVAQFKDAHFAVYPLDLIKTPIDAGCPKQVCKTCGKPRVMIYEKGEIIEERKAEGGKFADAKEELGNAGLRDGFKLHLRKQLGWSDCGHDNYRRGIVMDIFMGSGTTGVEAINNSKDFIGIEINPEFVKIAEKRFYNECHIPLDEFFD